MPITEVIHRISAIQQRFAVSLAPPGYQALQDAHNGSVAPVNGIGSGVIVGAMGQRPEVAAVRSAQAALPDGSGPVDNLASPLPGTDRIAVSGFGMRTHPVHGDVRMHQGVDLDAPEGSPIAAISDGIVTFAGERGSYGNLVIVDHGGGFETRYAHQQFLSVQTGDLVTAGDILGAVGSTGTSTGPHLHLEVRKDGIAVDPEPWLI